MHKGFLCTVQGNETMKVFIVNVNNCLDFAQYEPFFYEHMYNQQLFVLDEIKDTCDLNIAYEQIISQMNQRPFTIDEGAVFVFIPRDLLKPLRAQDYELYNDINVYMSLVRILNNNFRVYTFYVDQTGPLGSKDAVYNKLKKVNECLSSTEKRLEQYFPLLTVDKNSSGDYRDFIAEKIKNLNRCTQGFFSEVLQNMPEMGKDTVGFQNGVNFFIGNCKNLLSSVTHMNAHIISNDVSEEIEIKLKVVYYIKSLIESNASLKTISKFENFATPNYEQIKCLLATYRFRLSTWYDAPCPISKIGKYKECTFTQKTKSSADYNREVDAIINEHLKDLKTECNGERSIVDAVYEKLNVIVSAAHEKLELFAFKQSNDIRNLVNYEDNVGQEFDMSEPLVEDQLEEKLQLEKINQHSVHNLPMFSDENCLLQDLEIINNQIAQIFKRLKEYKKKSFFITLAVGIFVVAGLYLWTQSSVFVKEHTWLVFLGYVAVTSIGFASSYIVIKKKYHRQISALLLESKQLVEKYLSAYKEIAKEFEDNINESRKYYCLRYKLDQKEKARNKYKNDMERYLWHKNKVKEILTNFSFFDHFVQGTIPQKEEIVFNSFDHDDVHTDFYQIKFF